MFDTGKRVKLSPIGVALRWKAMFGWTGTVVGPGLDENWVIVDWDQAPTHNWSEHKLHIMLMPDAQLPDPQLPEGQAPT